MIRVKMFSLAISLLVISACGGGGGGGGAVLPPAEKEPTKAVVALSTSGGLSEGTRIGGVEITVVLPEGVTVAASPDSENPDTMVVDTGSLVAAPTASGALIKGTYYPATETDPGTVRILIAHSSGFATGAFAVLTSVLNGASPEASDFAVDGSSFTAYGIAEDSTLDISAGLVPELVITFR